MFIISTLLLLTFIWLNPLFREVKNHFAMVSSKLASLNCNIRGMPLKKKLFKNNFKANQSIPNIWKVGGILRHCYHVTYLHFRIHKFGKQNRCHFVNNILGPSTSAYFNWKFSSSVVAKLCWVPSPGGPRSSWVKSGDIYRLIEFSEHQTYIQTLCWISMNKWILPTSMFQHWKQ